MRTTLRGRRLLTSLTVAASVVVGLSACGGDDGEKPRYTSVAEKEAAASRSAQANPEPTTQSSTPTTSYSRSSGIPGFSVEAVDAAQNGELETKPIDRNDPNFDLPVSLPTPGISVEFHTDGTMKACTLAFMATLGNNLVGVTAGHCNRNADTSNTYWYRGGERKTSLGAFGKYCYEKTSCGDYGLIDIDDELGFDPRIAGVYKLRKVLEPGDLTAGMELCKYGRVTGESCGKLMGVQDNQGRAALHTISGDSGGPVYTKNADGTVDLVGIICRGTRNSQDQSVDTVTDFTFASAAVKGLGLTAVYI